MTFVAKRIHDHGTLAEDLRELRERAHMSVKDASAFTKVTPGTITAWEKGDWKSFGDELVYMERMLMSYVKQFHGRESFFKKKFHEELDKLTIKRVPAKTSIQALKPFSWHDVLFGWKTRVAAAVLIFGGILGGYFVAQARGLSEPPKLVIQSPVEGAKLDAPSVRVEGQSSPEAQVYINEQLATMKEDGSFFLDLDIPRGATELIIRAKKRHSREAVARVRVVFDRILEEPKEL